MKVYVVLEDASEGYAIFNLKVICSTPEAAKTYRDEQNRGDLEYQKKYARPPYRPSYFIEVWEMDKPESGQDYPNAQA